MNIPGCTWLGLLHGWVFPPRMCGDGESTLQNLPLKSAATIGLRTKNKQIKMCGSFFQDSNCLLIVKIHKKPCNKMGNMGESWMIYKIKIIILCKLKSISTINKLIMTCDIPPSPPRPLGSSAQVPQAAELLCRQMGLGDPQGLLDHRGATVTCHRDHGIEKSIFPT